MRNPPVVSQQVNAVANKGSCVRLLTIYACLSMSGPALATESGLSEADYLEDIPVVLSPTRLAQPVTEAPAAVTVIDREMIEASGARQIADLFRLVPGFTVGNLDGYTPSVTYHGFADEFSKRMQVLIDGRSVYLPSIGGVDWMSQTITLDDIERIEVIRGPDSASYGANSFLGVISITTRHAAEDKGKSVHVKSGEHRIRDGVVRFGAGTQALAYHLTLGYQQDDGFDTRHDTQRTRLFNGRVDYQLGVSDSLETQFGLSDGVRQAGYTADETDPPRNKGVISHFEQLRWLHSVGIAQEFSLQFYHNYHDTSDDFLSLPITLAPSLSVQLPLNLNIKAERYDLEFQDTLTAQRNLRLVWGGSARQDQVSAPTYFSTTNTLTTNLYRAFGNLEWHIRPWAVTNLGALIEHDDLTGNHIAPRLATNFHLDGHQTLRAVVSTATRTPILFEDRGDFKFTLDPANYPVPIVITDRVIVGNDMLKSERILSRELGYLFYAPEHGTSLDVKLYDDQLRDLIRADFVCKVVDPVCIPTNEATGVDNRDGNYLLYRNTDSASVRGLELQWDQRLGATTRVVFGYAHTLIYGDAANQPNAHSAPVNNLHVLLIQHLPADTQASVAYYQVGNMEYLGSGNHTDVQRRLDFRLARDFKRAADKFRVAVVVQNLLDAYQDFIYKPDTPTQQFPKNLFDTRAFIELEWDIP